MGVDAHDPGIRALTSARIPCVAVDVDLVGRRAGYVMSDNVAGAREAVRHLHGLGHERIAIIGGPPATRPGADRLLGYRAELEELGLPYRDEYVEEGDFYSGLRLRRNAGAARASRAAHGGLRGQRPDGGRRRTGGHRNGDSPCRTTSRSSASTTSSSRR